MLRRGWTQEQLGARCGMSRTAIHRIERGGAEDVTGRTLRRVAAALDARFEQRVLWRGEQLDRLLDRDHAAIVELVVRWLTVEGWQVAPEATFAIAGERGAIDVLAFHPETGSLLVVEVKSVMPDVQATIAGMDRKARLGPAVARARGWSPSTVSRLLVLPGDSTTRRRVEAHTATLSSVLPARTREVRRWARNPAGPLAGILFLERP
jgi:transcriptional regulator with XRE-family HTH domain